MDYSEWRVSDNRESHFLVIAECSSDDSLVLGQETVYTGMGFGEGFVISLMG